MTDHQRDHRRLSSAGARDRVGDPRQALADQLEQEIRPLLELGKDDGGYDCCGCSTYDAILDHAIRIVRGQAAPS